MTGPLGQLQELVQVPGVILTALEVKLEGSHELGVSCYVLGDVVSSPLVVELYCSGGRDLLQDLVSKMKVSE